MYDDLVEEVRELREEVVALKKINQEMLTLLYDKIYLEKPKETVKREGEHNPRFIKEVKTNDLVRDYIENGYHITKAMRKHYKDTYGITYNCVRERLIKAGIWKDNRNKNITNGESDNG